MAVSEYMFLPEVWFRISTFTQFTVALTVLAPYVLLYLACAADPGYVSSQNVKNYIHLYPYDHALFHPGQECRTCRIPKPARSKHCSVCKRCVGYGNQHYFLLLLVTTACLTTYGGFLGTSVLSSILRERYTDWSVWPPRHMTFNRWFGIWGNGLQRNVPLGASTLLATLISPLVWGLCVYSFYLVYCGTTTNETLKWSELQEDMRDGYAFRRYLPSGSRGAVSSRWPVEPEHIILVTNDGQPPNPSPLIPGEGEWERPRQLQDVENMYDLGFWENLCDIFVPSYAFGNLVSKDEPLAERKRSTKRAADRRLY
jgi:hypothetical protein